MILTAHCPCIPRYVAAYYSSALRSRLRSPAINRSRILAPAAIRFHPTDEELIVYYLRNQAMTQPCPAPIKPKLNIYKFDPWELTELVERGWYLFTPHNRKYPNGMRSNRATASGYWKATGTEKAIYSSSRYVGVKKALVFYEGRPPKGSKTNRIMHEYHLHSHTHSPFKPNKSMIT